MTDYKALAAELLTALEIQLDELALTNRLCKRARTALAEGAGVGPTDAALRVAHYLEQRRLIRGLDPEEIHGLHAGTDEPRQATLTVSDLEALIRTTHPRPIPVAERLPTEADCDAEGRCWFWESYMERWELDDRTHGINLTRVAWLPAAAIPLPEVES
jgi:hypothetical protein